jgi:hypothetical protein
MKKFTTFSILSFSLVLSSTTTEARDLTYRLGVGYSQMSHSVRPKAATTSALTEGHGLHVTYGVATDMHAGLWFGFADNFKQAAVGPTFRYDLQRLINRDATIWNYVNIFAQVAFLGKIGSDQKKGIALHLPYLGFEILPFDRVNLAISTSAGLIVDFVDKNKINFTQSKFGDVGVRYYF